MKALKIIRLTAIILLFTAGLAKNATSQTSAAQATEVYEYVFVHTVNRGVHFAFGSGKTETVKTKRSEDSITRLAIELGKLSEDSWEVVSTSIFPETANTQVLLKRKVVRKTGKG